jgi:predicted Rossmann fold flavoprotein
MDKINSNKSIFMSKRKVIVIGAGAAGMMAAGQAAENGADTLLLEKMKRPGRKLCITGKGRCNITNAGEIAEFIEHFGRTGSFLRQAFSRFFNTDLMDFFKELGLEVVTERGGRVFPASGKAPDVLSVLLQWLKRRGVNIMNSTPVDELVIRRGKVRGVVCRGREIPCEAVVLATGGASYPATGSAGDGYRIGECAGHSLVPVRPALVPLETSGDSVKKMAGLSLKNISVRLIVNSRKRKEAFGEMMFAKFGVTGPVILLLSGEAVDALRDGSKVSLSIDLKPALSDKKLDARLLRDLAARGKEPADSFLRGLLPREMVPVCLSLTEIPRDCLAAQISAKRRGRLRAWLKDFRLEVTRSRPFDEAIVTAGGIETREINPRTLESRRTKGLFIAGELLDIQADTGGYNLQAAFSTGWLAGRSAAHGTL